MKLRFLVFLFILLSILLIITALNNQLNQLRSAYNEQVRLENIQHVSKKKEKRERKTYVPTYTIEQANKTIISILTQTPIYVEADEYSSLTKSTLAKIVAIINKLEKRAVLSIKVERYKKKSPSNNLKISQKNADRLKAYFLDRTKLSFISAIGYGSALVPQKYNDKHNGLDCYVKMRLKKVK
jgi:outer membrane protein OmpA-like peptidoglycan-associated protein